MLVSRRLGTLSPRSTVLTEAFYKSGTLRLSATRARVGISSPSLRVQSRDLEVVLHQVALALAMRVKISITTGGVLACGLRVAVPGLELTGFRNHCAVLICRVWYQRCSQAKT